MFRLAPLFFVFFLWLPLTCSASDLEDLSEILFRESLSNINSSDDSSSVFVMYSWPYYGDERGFPDNSELAHRLIRD